jgi:hypothetical protein
MNENHGYVRNEEREWVPRIPTINMIDVLQNKV